MENLGSRNLKKSRNLGKKYLKSRDLGTKKGESRNLGILFPPHVRKYFKFNLKWNENSLIFFEKDFEDFFINFQKLSDFLQRFWIFLSRFLRFLRFLRLFLQSVRDFFGVIYPLTINSIKNTPKMEKLLRESWRDL